MIPLSRIICLSVVVACLLTSPFALADHKRGIKFEANGLELFGWIPYSTGKAVSIPPTKLPTGEMPLDFPATIVNFPRNGQTHDFTLTIAVDRKIDHTKLQLIARDAQDLIVPDITFSVVSTSGDSNQIITFICSAKSDPNLIKQLVIAKQLAPALQKQL